MTISAVVALTTSLYVTRAAALGAAPAFIEISAKPGVIYNGSVEVTGNAKTSETVRIYTEDWDLTPKGEDVSSAPGAIDRSCAGWMTLSHSKFDIPVGGGTSVKYSITVPETASGSYWTFIIVESGRKPTKPDDMPNKMQFVIQATFRYAIRVFVNVEQGKKIEGNITGVGVMQKENPLVKKESVLTAVTTFSNTGNTTVKPQGYVEIRTVDGETVKKIDVLPKTYVIPGRSREIYSPIGNDLPEGDYVALAVLDFGGESYVAGENTFSVKKTPDAEKKDK